MSTEILDKYLILGVVILIIMPCISGHFVALRVPSLEVVISVVIVMSECADMLPYSFSSSHFNFQLKTI